MVLRMDGKVIAPPDALSAVTDAAPSLVSMGMKVAIEQMVGVQHPQQGLLYRDDEGDPTSTGRASKIMVKSFFSKTINAVTTPAKYHTQLQQPTPTMVAAAAEKMAELTHDTMASKLLLACSSTIEQQEVAAEEHSVLMKETMAELQERNRQLEEENRRLKSAIQFNNIKISSYGKEVDQLKTAMEQLKQSAKSKAGGSRSYKSKAAAYEHSCCRQDADAYWEDGDKGNGNGNGSFESKHTKARAIKSCVSEILRFSQRSSLKCGEIVDGVLSSSLLSNVINRGKYSMSKGDLVAQDIMKELVHSIGKLKKSARGSAEWHAYQSILNAIVPDKYSLENASALAKGTGVTYRKVASVSQRNTRINIDGDGSNTVSKRRDSFEIKYAHFVPVITAYCENETQQDPSRACVCACVCVVVAVS